MSSSYNQRPKARTPAELDRQIDALSAETKLRFAQSLRTESIGLADKTVGINDMWISARLAGRLLNTNYYRQVVGAVNK